jgi:flagellar motility protein MotE (MotC chaperone)
MPAMMHRPRLLPATILAMGLLLVLKSASLVWAATAAEAGHGGEAVAADKGGAKAAGDPGGEKPAAAGPREPAAGRAPTPDARAMPANIMSERVGKENSPQAPPVSDAERGVLLDLRHRREAIDERSHELEQRSAVLTAAETKLAARVEQLGALQAKLEQLDADRRAHDDANWTGLVHVYETMKPREAAAIFDALDMQVLLAVLDRMQPRRAAPVLAAMQPDRARLATQMLAELRTRMVTPPGEAGTVSRVNAAPAP